MNTGVKAIRLCFLLRSEQVLLMRPNFRIPGHVLLSAGTSLLVAPPALSSSSQHARAWVWFQVKHQLAWTAGVHPASIGTGVDS